MAGEDWVKGPNGSCKSCKLKSLLFLCTSRSWPAEETVGEENDEEMELLELSPVVCMLKCGSVCSSSASMVGLCTGEPLTADFSLGLISRRAG